MTDWKETAINDYIVAKTQQLLLLDAEEIDVKLVQKRAQIAQMVVELDELSKPFDAKIDEIDSHIERLHSSLVEGWDIEDKTYKCKAGTATLRTTKALTIDKKADLITLLMNIGKLPECIRSWNISYLRKLKDVDIIEDTIAHYEEHQNVIIKGAEDK